MNKTMYNERNATRVTADILRGRIKKKKKEVKDSMKSINATKEQRFWERKKKDPRKRL